MNNGFISNINPIITTLGPIQLRYYGLIFMMMFWVSFFVWRHYMKRGGYSDELLSAYLPWFLVSLLLGARLGHCFFYEPTRFLADPVSILFFWKGGLASHGATIGLLIGLYLFTRVHHVSYIDIIDRFSPGAAIAAAAIRLGNFFNSEIVGKATDLPWAVRFMRYSDYGTIPRHPSQIYEFTLGIAVLTLLLFVDKKFKKEARPRGLITGVFAVAYFGGRFFVEFTKEYQGIDNGWPLTMGQILCIPFVLIGAWLIFRSGSKVQSAHAKQL